MIKVPLVRALVLSIAFFWSIFAGIVLGDDKIDGFQGRIAVNAKDSVPSWPEPARVSSHAPNVVIVLLDDVGFGATSTAGGPVKMPALDGLAARGLRYNNFNSTALCSPTRAALLSGRNDHRVGFGTVIDSASGFPGYNGIWGKDNISIAEILRRNGYSTAAFGKWHNTPYWEVTPVGPFDRWPTGLGFEHFYGFMVGGASQWEPPLYRNTLAIEPPKTAEQGYQFSADIVDEAISWLHTHQSLVPEKPYFMYVATGAAHGPHHVPREWTEKYRGKFDMGWDKLREDIFVRQKRQGVIPVSTQLTPRPKELPAWDTFSTDEKRLLTRQMELFAAHLEYTDHQLQRLFEAIRQGPDADNTLIIYIAGDNGASGESALTGTDLRQDGLSAPSIEARLAHIDEFGGPNYSNQYSAGWAWATNTPFQWMKQVASHFGGTRNMVVVSWPERIKDFGGVRSQFTHVNAVAATLYEVIGIELPSSVDGVKQKSLDGPSFAYTFGNAAESSRHRLQIFEQMGNRAIYSDGWMASARHAIPWVFNRSEDFTKDRWELYHVAKDFSQAQDLAEKHPKKLEELKKLFDIEARKNDIYPLSNSFGNGEFGVGQPRLAGMERRNLVFYPGLPRLPVSQSPDFRGAHRISASLQVPADGTDGAIISLGDRSGGFVFYVKDGRLVYENNFLGTRRDLIVSASRLPAGRVEVAYEFDRAKANGLSGGGTGRLFVNGEKVAESTLSRFEPPALFMSWSGSFSVGRVFGSPVSSAYRKPFTLAGLEIVRVELLDDTVEKAASSHH